MSPTSFSAQLSVSFSPVMLSEVGLTIKGAKQDASLSKGVLFPHRGDSNEHDQTPSFIKFHFIPFSSSMQRGIVKTFSSSFHKSLYSF